MIFVKQTFLNFELSALSVIKVSKVNDAPSLISVPERPTVAVLMMVEPADGDGGTSIITSLRPGPVAAAAPAGPLPAFPIVVCEFQALPLLSSRSDNK